MKTLVITPQKGIVQNTFKELVGYRDLFFFLAWRDIKVRYKQTAIGVLWALFVPLITMVVFTVFFGNFAQIDSNGIPYPIFVYIGLVFWTFFSQAVTAASTSLINSQEIVKKTYFPRLLLPASSIFVALIDFIIASIVYIGLMVYYGIVPQLLTIVLFPLLALITYIASLGIGLFLAAVNVKYRDVRYALPFFIQILLFVTPVIYPVSIAAADARWLLLLNPMTGVIETARATLLTSDAIDWTMIEIASLVSVIFFVVGLIYFKRTERYFADII